jgi:hypothetical protein
VTLFDGSSQRALPLTGSSVPGETSTPHRNPDVDEQRLLILLLSGLTDTEIARQLGGTTSVTYTRSVEFGG